MTLTGSCTEQPDAGPTWKPAKSNTVNANDFPEEVSSEVGRRHPASWLPDSAGLKLFEKNLGSRVFRITAKIAAGRSYLPGGLINSVRWIRRIIRTGGPQAGNQAGHNEMASGMGCEDGISTDPQVGALRKAMADLPPELREALILVTVDRLSYRDAADYQGVSVACLNGRVARARAILAEDLCLLAQGTARLR